MKSNYTTTPKKKQTIQALWRLEKIILNSLDFKEVIEKIVNSVLTELDYLQLGYRIVVLILKDPKNNLLKRVSISQTKEAEKALKASPIPFPQINIPLTSKKNLCVKVFKSKKPATTSYWPDLLMPAFTNEQAIEVQKIVGIKESLVYPVISQNQSIGVIIFSMTKTEEEVTLEERDLISGFTDVVGLAVQNARLYTSVEETTLKLKEANGQLKELDRLKDEFVSVASHELRTPMTAIKSYLWMALNGKGGKLLEKQKYYLDRAYLSTDRLIKLVNDMLNVSRIEAGRVALSVEEVDLNKLALEVIDEVKPRADELGLKIKVNKVDKLTEVIADVDKIKEVLINFIGNSLKFTPHGGLIEISFEEKVDTVVTSVKDNGKGVEKDDQPKLFEKFGLLKGSYTTNTISQGTGLGLYICKSIIQLHKGEIWAESEGRDKGSKFSFSLRKYNVKDLKKIQSEQDGKESKEIIHTGI